MQSFEMWYFLCHLKVIEEIQKNIVFHICLPGSYLLEVAKRNKQKKITGKSKRYF